MSAITIISNILFTMEQLLLAEWQYNEKEECYETQLRDIQGKEHRIYHYEEQYFYTIA